MSKANLIKIKSLIQDFENVQKKYSDAGAWDTEPSFKFQLALKKAIVNKKNIIPKNDLPEWWELYIGEKNVNKAAVELTETANIIVNEVIENSDSISIRDYLVERYCWRV